MKQEKNNKVLRLFCVLFSVCFAMAPIGARAVTLYLLPQSQTIYQGDTFLVEVKLDTEGEEINTVEGYLNFPQDKLEIIDIGVGGSIFNLWPKSPSYSNQTGEISFLGGIPRGFKGEGKLVSTTFRVLPRVDPHQSFSITFKENSKVLLNDGKGTPAKLNFLEGNYEIISRPAGLPVLISPSNPDQNKWYPADSFEIHWKAKPEAEYSYILSHDPLMKPDEIPEKLIEHLKWGKLEDGIYYFHLREKMPGKDWSEKITYRFMIDMTPPEEFQPEIGKDPSIFEGKYFLSFATTDKTSGVDHYEILEEPQRNLLKRIFTQSRHKTEHETTQNWKVGESPYLLGDQSLKTKILVKAVDKAGNEKISEIIPFKKPIPYKEILIILASIIIIIWIIYRLTRKRKLYGKN